MRLWSVHPRYLDRQGLVACWREALLAQAVLAGRTKGYTHHPQLRRFRETGDPLVVLGAYLGPVADEAQRRGYRFDRTRITSPSQLSGAIDVTEGQLSHEWAHLTGKLSSRSPAVLAQLASVRRPECHPLFRLVAGPVADWEVVRTSDR